MGEIEKGIKAKKFKVECYKDGKNDLSLEIVCKDFTTVLDILGENAKYICYVSCTYVTVCL